VNTIPNPDNWMDVFTILAVALIAAVPSWLAHKNHKVVKKIEGQVVNGHGGEGKPGLRDDLDRAIAAIEALSHDLRSLKADLMLESDHRRLQISDLQDELHHRDRRRP
jgi:hypothetical protein